MDFLQGPLVIADVHQTHHRGHKVEFLRPKRQLQSAGYRVPNGAALSRPRFGRGAHEGGSDIHGEHIRTAFRKESRVVAFPATYVQASPAGHIRKQIEKGRRIHGVAIDIPALAREAGPGSRIAFPVKSRLAIIHHSILAHALT